MPSNTKYRSNDLIDSWKLIRVLGAGGNAEVWEAKNNNGRRAALKILKSTTRDSEPFRRFEAEICVLKRLGNYPGILPVIDALLPDQPSKAAPAWLAVPIATPIRDKLGDTHRLETVVEAIRDVARTLSKLTSEYGISHRDIKPDNLYHFADGWVIGDFGLVDFPEKESLTQSGKKLGPAFYIAPEMLTDPDKSNGASADVYSLAKTLWVLSTGYIYPLPGEQRIDVPQLRLSTYVSHPKARLLDQLVEDATKTDPQQRSSMNYVANELEAWLSFQDRPVEPDDISGIGKLLRALIEPSHRMDEIQQQSIEEARIILYRLARQLQQLAGRLRDASLPVLGGMDSYDTVFDTCLPAAEGKGLNITWKDERCIMVRGLISAARPIILLSGVATALLEDQQLCLVAGHIIDHVSGNLGKEILWSDWRIVKLGSAQQEQVIELLIAGLTTTLRDALEKFAACLSESGQRSGIDSEQSISSVQPLRERVKGAQIRHELTLKTPAPIYSLAFSPTADDMAVGDDEGYISIGNITELRHRFKAHEKRVWSLDYSTDGSMLVSGSQDGRIILWSQSGDLICCLGQLGGSIMSVHFSPDGKYILSGHKVDDESSVPRVVLWSITDRKMIDNFDKIHTKNVYCVRFRPDGQGFFSAGSDNIVAHWSLQDDRIVFRSENNNATVSHIDVSSREEIIASGAWNGIIKIWDFNGDVLKTIEAHNGRIVSLCFSKTGKLLASAGKNDEIAIWQIPEGSLVARIAAAHSGVVRGLAFGNDDITLISGSTDTTCRIWSLTTPS